MVAYSKRQGHSSLLLLALLFCCTLALAGGAAAQTGPNSIEGFVFNDLDANDLSGSFDAAVPGVTITLRDANGTPLGATTTGPDGRFQFPNLARGVYLITETDAPGFFSIDAIPGSGGTTVDLNTVRISMVEGVDTYAGTVFLDRQSGAPPAGPNIIKGAVFNDADANGQIDVGERPLRGVLVTLRDAANNVVGTRLSAGTGQFAFSGLPSGTFTLVESDPPGVVSVAAAAGRGGQALDPNTIRVTTVEGVVSYEGHVFLDRLVDGSDPDPGPGPVPVLGLSLTKTVDRTTAAPGDVLTFTLIFRNTGGVLVSNALLFDVLPAGTQFLEVAAAGQLSANTVAWSIPSLPPGGSGSVSFRVRVLETTLPGMPISNQAHISVAGQTQLVSSNVVTTIVAGPGAALTLAKSVDRVVAQPGEILTYTLRYANLGATPVAAVIADPLPVGLNFLDAQANVQIDIPTRTLRFDVGILAPGAAGTITFRAVVAANVPNGTPLTNRASLSSPALPQPVASNEVTTVVGAVTASFVGTYTLGENSPNPTWITVDPQHRFTVATVPSDGLTPGEGTQGILNPDGSFDVITANGRVRFTGRIDPSNRTAAVTVSRSRVASYTVVLPRASDLNPVPQVLIGTYVGFATNLAGDRLQVMMTIDPVGNSTFQADLIQRFPFLIRHRTGGYEVTPDGRLTVGARTDGTLQVVGNSLVLNYNYAAAGYQSTFQIPLVRQ